MQHRQTTPSPARDQLVAFLDSHLGVAHRDDVGPLFGEIAMMEESVVFTAALAANLDDAPRRAESKPAK
jgi:hypothetical protein